jgi:hypothetical protein
MGWRDRNQSWEIILAVMMMGAEDESKRTSAGLDNDFLENHP